LTTKGEIARLRRQFFPFGKYNIGKRCTEAAGPSVHLFSSESGPALIRADGTNRESDAGTLKNDVPALIVCRRRANERADVRRQ